MNFTADHDHHFHTYLSTCCTDSSMTAQNCLAAAEDMGYSSICVTNHTWDNLIPGASDWYAPQDVEHGFLENPLPQGLHTRFYMGCESEFTENGLALSPVHFDMYDFIAVPLNHFHMEGLVRPADVTTDEEIAELFLHRIDMFSSMDIPYEKFGVAHMTCSLMKRSGDARDVLNIISDSDYSRIFKKFASLGCGIELNCNDFKLFSDNIEPLLRVYRIAKKCGCRFYLGSDAHRMDHFTTVQDTLNEVISLLALTPGDKYTIPER